MSTTREQWFRDRRLIYRGERDGMHVGDLDPTANPDRSPKSSWPQGPWHDEPDYATWVTKTGLQGLIVRNYAGTLCGYASVPKGMKVTDYSALDVDVHGGLTFAGECHGRICHYTPSEDRAFWVGFDCNHAGDHSPAYGSFEPTDQYRDLSYVRDQVENLARQLVELASRK